MPKWGKPPRHSLTYFVFRILRSGPPSGEVLAVRISVHLTLISSAMNTSTTDHPGPFAPVQKVSVSAPGQSPSGYSIRLEDSSTEEGWYEAGECPPDHLLVTNQELYCMADEIASRSPFDWRGVRLFFDGQRFAYALSTSDVFEDVGGREALCGGLLFQTSYDGSWATGCRLFGYRLISTSGLLHGQNFGHLQFEHSLCSDAWDEEFHRALDYADEVLDKLESFGEMAHLLKNRSLSSTDLAQLRRGPLADLPSPLWGQILDRYLDKNRRTAWGLVTAGTSLLWNDEDRPLLANDFRYNQTLLEGVSHLIGSENGATG